MYPLCLCYHKIIVLVLILISSVKINCQIGQRSQVIKETPLEYNLWLPYIQHTKRNISKNTYPENQPKHTENIQKTSENKNKTGFKFYSETIGPAGRSGRSPLSFFEATIIQWKKQKFNFLSGFRRNYQCGNSNVKSVSFFLLVNSPWDSEYLRWDSTRRAVSVWRTDETMN